MSKLVLCILLGFIALTYGVFVNGSKNNDGVGIYEIKNGKFSLKLTNYGARITSVVLPDKNGNLTDIVLGYDTAQDYLNHSDHFGAIVGRVAGRIAGAKFTLNGTVYKLDANDGNNSIHGGKNGFSQVVWTVTKHEKCSITLTYNSSDGEEGFPGNVSASVTYALIEPYKLSVKMEAESLNKPTPINLAQHSFWNLNGHNSGDILSDDLQLFAHNITSVDEELIPTGKIQPVKNTPYDFLKLREIKTQMDKLPNGTKGYDTNYVVDGYGGGELRPVAVVHSEKSGIKMELSANQPGVQLYTGNSLKNVTGKGGYVYQAYAGLCLETQGFPDSVNHPNFPSQIISPGERYDHRMMFSFSTKK